MSTGPDPGTADVLRREERKRLYQNGYEDGVTAERQRCQAKLRDLGYPDLAEWLADPDGAS